MNWFQQWRKLWIASLVSVASFALIACACALVVIWLLAHGEFWWCLPNGAALVLMVLCVLMACDDARRYRRNMRQEALRALSNGGE